VLRVLMPSGMAAAEYPDPGPRSATRCCSYGGDQRADRQRRHRDEGIRRLNMCRGAP
jgi:hypothetical protein